MSSEKILVARYVVQPGQMQSVEQSLQRMAAAVRVAEPDCLVYEVGKSVDKENELLLYEVYRDQSALEAHPTTPHYKEIIQGQVAPLLVSRVREVLVPLIRADSNAR